MPRQDGFKVNGLYYDGTSISLLLPAKLQTDRIYRELKSITLDPQVMGVEPMFGTGRDCLGSNGGRVVVHNPSMSMTVEAWNELVPQLSAMAPNGKLSLLQFNFKIFLKAADSTAKIEIDCFGARFLGMPIKGFTSEAKELLVEPPMFIKAATWNGFSL